MFTQSLVIMALLEIGHIIQSKEFLAGAVVGHLLQGEQQAGVLL